MFEEAKQKPKHGGTTFSLGWAILSYFTLILILTNSMVVFRSKFTSWNPSAEAGSPEYYSKQVYDRGGQCWNGPQRSVVVLMKDFLAFAVITDCDRFPRSY
jgi:protein kinase C substrate 80K-H